MAYGACPAESRKHPEGLLQGVIGAQGKNHDREGRPARGALKLDREHAGRDLVRRFHIDDIPWNSGDSAGKSSDIRIPAGFAMGGAGPGVLTLSTGCSYAGKDGMLDTSMRALSPGR